MNYKLLSELTILVDSGHERLSFTARSAINEIEKLHKVIEQLTLEMLKEDGERL